MISEALQKRKIVLWMSHSKRPHQRLNGFALKTSRREVPGSITSLACRPKRSEFSVVFPENRVNTI